ncbi:MAG: peptide deformylase [Magnetovibrio sp.]|nr:peptide deformylase [Magnetovibrio sp.]
MVLLPIIVAPDPRLKVKTQPVSKVDNALIAFLDDMLETMYAADGIGLAAPQVADRRSLIVLDVSRSEDRPHPLYFINPEILWSSEEQRIHQEGCLSLPEHYAEVTRPASIRIKYWDKTGSTQELEADGILATCIQHEMDHLKGILFVDHVSSLKRHMILRKLKKAKKSAMA